MALEIRVVAEDVASPSPSPSPSPLNPASPVHPEGPPQKLRGRRRLLHGFQRMSSSPSLARLARTPSSGYKTGKASVSCISLSSAITPYGPSFGPSLSTELSTGHATPHSTASTPGIQIPVWDEGARLRYLEKLTPAATTAAVPRGVTRAVTPSIVEEEDYFSMRTSTAKPPTRTNFNIWEHMPSEIRTQILSYLEPKEVVKCSAVSKAWHRHCFDGQLWAVLDACDFYKRISADALVSIITSAGPFVRDLNLRGCVQLREKWHFGGFADACRNLEYFSLEGCKIDRTSIHCLLLQNPRLVHLDLTGLTGVTNQAMKIISQTCPLLEHLNVSWCVNMDTRGLRKIFEHCKRLKDLRAGEMRGWDDLDFVQLLFETNNLERLKLMNCPTFADESLKTLVEGKDSEIDLITGRPIVPPRRLKRLDISCCPGVTDAGMRACINRLDDMEALKLNKCSTISDASLVDLIPTMPNLTRLDVEELDQLSNTFLQTLANSPCAPQMRRLIISSCENLGDSGMLPVLKTCTALTRLEMDNTRISDLVLVEAAAMVRARSVRTMDSKSKPKASLDLVAYDCQNVTWTGIREIMSRNAEVLTTRRTVHSPSPIPARAPTPDTTTPTSSSSSLTKSSRPSDDQARPTAAPVPPTVTIETVQLVRTYPTDIIALKCFYNYQPTVFEHTKRVLRGDFASANRLERKWADFMIANEEAGAGGAGSRRRRRRAREAEMMHADEAGGPEAGNGGIGGGRRRRARSGGCVVM